MITAVQFEAIREIVRIHHEAVVEAIAGVAQLSPAIIERLEQLGVPRWGGPAIVEEATQYGVLTSALPDPFAAESMTYEEFQDRLAARREPLSREEAHAAREVSRMGATYCRGLGNRVEEQTGRVLIEVDMQRREATEQTFRAVVRRGLERRLTRQEITTQLGRATGDWARDLRRIANTEANNGIQMGRGAAIAEDYGEDAAVAKVPNPGACPRCKSLYLDEEGNPRVFVLSEIRYQTNARHPDDPTRARRQAEWVPTLESIHPHCCPAGQLVTCRRGMVPIEDVVIGDTVLTHRGRWRRVTGLFWKQYTGSLTEMLTHRGSVSSTGDHTWLFGDGWREAESCQEGDKLSRAKVTCAIGETDDGPPVGNQSRLLASILFQFAAGGMPVAAIHLHGELPAGVGNVDHILLHRIGSDDLVACVAQNGQQLSLHARAQLPTIALRALPFLFQRSLPAAVRRPGAFHAAPWTQAHGVGPGSDADSVVSHEGAEGARRHAECGADVGCAGALFEIELPESGFGEPDLRALSTGAGDAFALETISDGGPGDAELFSDLRQREPGLQEILRLRHINLDSPHEELLGVECSIDSIKVAEVRSIDYSGLVRDLTVEEDHSFSVGEIRAVAHNCQCQVTRVPEGWTFDRTGPERWALVPDDGGGEGEEP